MALVAICGVHRAWVVYQSVSRPCGLRLWFGQVGHAAMTVKSMPSRWESLNINPTERQLVFIVSCWGNVERSNTERKRSETEMRRTAFQDRLATSYITIIISIITHTTRRHLSW